MFSFGHEGLAADSEELYKHPLFKRHAKGVVNMLDTAIGMLGPDVSPLLEALKSLGARHFEYGVLPAHYPIVGEALILTLETALGKKWTPKVKQGWAAIYGIVSTAMLEGANQRIEMENKVRGKISQEEGEDKQPESNEEVVPLAPGEAPPTKEKKKRMTVKKDKSLTSLTSTMPSLPEMPIKSKDCASYQKAAAIRSNLRRRRMMRKSKIDELSRSTTHDVTKTLDEALSLSSSMHSTLSTTSNYSMSSTPSFSDVPDLPPVETSMKERVSYLTMVEKVMDSWYTIKSIPNYKEVAGVLLFRNIFKIAPAAKGLFQFTKGYDEADEEALYKSRAFIAHAKTVVKMLDAAINMLSDLDILGAELEKLGARHVSYGVLVPHYEVVGQALLQTLEQALGKDGWNDTIKEGWTGIYVFVSTSMIRGAKDVAKEQYKQQEQTTTSVAPAVVA